MNESTPIISPAPNAITKVNIENERSTCGTLKPCISLKSQKKLLFTWIMPSEPAHMAAAVSVGSRWPPPTMGATIEEVVKSETVIEPVIVVNTKLSKNGSTKPSVLISLKLAMSSLTTWLSFITWPNAPPAPVISITIAHFDAACPKSVFNFSEKPSFFSKNKEIQRPIMRDQTGFRIKRMTVFSPLYIAPKPIKTKGANSAKNGRDLLKPAS